QHACHGARQQRGKHDADAQVMPGPAPDQPGIADQFLDVEKALRITGFHGGSWRYQQRTTRQIMSLFESARYVVEVCYQTEPVVQKSTRLYSAFNDSSKVFILPRESAW
ncbi:hypothetical protein C1H84_09125, partial [Glutamicibacter soli]